MPKWCWSLVGGQDQAVAINLDEERGGEEEDGELIDDNEEKGEDGEDEAAED